MTQSNFSLNFKFNFCALALSLAALIPCLSWADPVSTTGSFPASATVVQPLTITGASTLSFGSFVAVVRAIAAANRVHAAASIQSCCVPKLLP